MPHPCVLAVALVASRVGNGMRDESIGLSGSLAHPWVLAVALVTSRVGLGNVSIGLLVSLAHPRVGGLLIPLAHPCVFVAIPVASYAIARTASTRRLEDAQHQHNSRKTHPSAIHCALETHSFRCSAGL